ncbi:MAG: hypothetical protein QW212_06675, partial [Nitrososphaerales archaeon]
NSVFLTIMESGNKMVAPAEGGQAGAGAKAPLQMVLEIIRAKYDKNVDHGMVRKYAEALVKTILEKKRIVVRASEVEETYKEIIDRDVDKGFDAFDFMHVLRFVLDNSDLDNSLWIVNIFYDEREAIRTIFAVLPEWWSKDNELLDMLDAVSKLVDMTESSDYKTLRPYSLQGADTEKLMYLLSDYVTYVSAMSKRNNAPWIAYRLAKLLIPEVVEIYDEFGSLVEVKIMLDNKTYTLENDYELWWP